MANLHRRISPDDGITVRRLVPRLFQQYRSGTAASIISCRDRSSPNTCRAYAKANPGKINMATAGSGSMLDVYGELFMMMAGVDMVRVPYRGAPPAVTDLVGGRVDVVFDTFAASIALVRAGQLRALAVTTATRSEALPDIPSLGDFLPGYDASSWRGITDNGMCRVLRHNHGRTITNNVGGQ
jgi:tripartite-type tricarboxylate transporter receptor subunit TctC